MTDFYVYKYLRSKASEHGPAGGPYYIGKGWGRRAFRKEHGVHIPKDKANIVLLSAGMSEPDAHQLEMLLIHFFGRIDRLTGCLRNLTDGGDGVRGRVVPEEERQAISKRGKKRWGSLTENEEREWLQAIREGWAVRTEEQNREYSKTVSQAMTAWHASLSEDEKREWSEARREGLASLTDEEKRAWREALSEAHKEYWASLTEEQKHERGQATRERWASLTEDEKRKWGDALSVAQKKRWASLTEDEKREAAQERYANLSDDEKQRQNQQLHAALAKYWANLPAERRGEAATKYWASLTEEEAAERGLAVKAWHASLTGEQMTQRNEALRAAATKQWANFTEVQLRAWKKAWLLGRANMSEELKRQLAEKNGKFHKARIAGLSPEEREERNAQLHAALLNRWANTPKKIRCPKGHPYDEQNTYINPSNGHRQCKICVRASKARYKDKRPVPNPQAICR